MGVAAVVFIAGINLEIDLRGLFRPRVARTNPQVTCGIKVVGYHMFGQPGQTFSYGGETFTIPSVGYVEVIADSKLQHYVYDGRRLLLNADLWPLDGFGFRWIPLPTPIKGEQR